MNAFDVKMSVMLYSLYILNSSFVVDELDLFPPCISDVLAGIYMGYIYEFEVKVSLSDLKVDIHKPRHKQLSQGALAVTGYLPNYFAFAVPSPIANSSKKIVEGTYKGAGLLSCYTDYRKNKWVIVPNLVHCYPTAKIREAALLRGLSRRYIRAYERSVKANNGNTKQRPRQKKSTRR